MYVLIVSVRRFILNIPKVRSVVYENGSDSRLVLLQLTEKGELRHTEGEGVTDLALVYMGVKYGRDMIGCVCGIHRFITT